MSLHRKIWIQVNGPIPVDAQGRTFEIHHINGDHFDNRLENLQCLSIMDHYKVHLLQADFQAAAAIAQRMGIEVETQANLNRLSGLEAVENKRGIHGLSSEERLANSSKGGKGHLGYKWYNNGEVEVQSPQQPGPEWELGRTCTTCGYAAGTKIGRFWNNGKINIRAERSPGADWTRGKLLSDEQRSRRSEIACSQPRTQDSRNKTSATLKNRPKPQIICPHCGKVGGIGAMKRWHFELCKENLDACS